MRIFIVFLCLSFILLSNQMLANTEPDGSDGGFGGSSGGAGDARVGPEAGTYQEFLKIHTGLLARFPELESGSNAEFNTIVSNAWSVGSDEAYTEGSRLLMGLLEKLQREQVERETARFKGSPQGQFNELVTAALEIFPEEHDARPQFNEIMETAIAEWSDEGFSLAAFLLVGLITLHTSDINILHMPQDL